MKSAFTLFVAFIAMAGLITAQESFDTTATGAGSVPAGWATGVTDNAWTCHTGGTGSGGTGPSGDVCGSGNYMYCETSGFAGLSFDMHCPTGLPAGSLDFSYHMLGSAMGTLEVQEADGAGGWTTLWGVSGDQGNNWSGQSVATSGADIRFFYTNGSSFTGDCSIDQVSLPGDPANPVLLSSNNADASLDINGSASPTICGGDPVSLNLAINPGNAGALHDVGVDSAIVTSCGGGLALIDDAVNLDLATASSLYGGAAASSLQPMGLGFGGGAAMSLNFVAAPTAASVALQMGCLDASDPDGISMSGTATYSAAPAFGVLALGDDDNISITGTPVCGSAFVDVAFYGTVYSECFVGSNGEVTFVSGSSDFTATQAEWETQMPRIGCAGDLEPNNYGTVTYSQLADGFKVDYANVAEWGTGGLGVISFTVEVSASAGASISGMASDGLWGGTPTCVGLSNGSAGTHTGSVSLSGAAGAGPSAGAATDSFFEATAGLAAGMGTTVSSISAPAGDGSAVIVN